jgi:glycerol-3-phosphate dehydrogenase
LTEADFDVLVVGAGITGACVALDAATRGLRTALVDRGDFGGGATANCLRIVHGGLRYLQHLDARRSRESIIERSVWLRSAPHLVEPLPVIIPTMRGRFPHRWMLGAALAMDEALSFDRNEGVESDRRIPRARVLSRTECAALMPALDSAGLSGGALFHDAIMYSPERLTLEVVQAAQKAGAVTANYVAFEAASIRNGQVTGGSLRDVLTNEGIAIRARWIVNATGALSGHVARLIAGERKSGQQRYSVALNLVTRQPAASRAYTVSSGAADPDRKLGAGGRQLLVVPWRDQRIVGTAHFPFSGDPASAALPEKHAEHFLKEIAASSPPLSVTGDDVRLVQWGLLPVAGPPASDRVRLLKRHRIVDHASEGVGGAFSVVSVKFTTARRVAADVVDRLTGAKAPRTTSALTIPLPGKPVQSMAATLADARARYAPLLPDDVIEHLVRAYGSRYERVIALSREIDGGDRRLSPDAPVILAQLVYGAREEQARTAEDLLWRRCELGPRGLVTAELEHEARRALVVARAEA